MIKRVLRSLVEQKYFNIIQLSNFLGVNRKTITRWYRTELQPDPKNYLKILNLSLTAGVISQEEKERAIFDKYSLQINEMKSVDKEITRLKKMLSKKQYEYLKDLV